MSARLRILSILALTCAFAAALGAEVQIKTLPDGSKLISNESFEQRARRVASRLLPVPKADLEPLIDIYARDVGLSPRLVQAVIQVESGYNVRALSNKGAMGLMQLIPGTAALMGVKEPFDARDNIRGGTRYLRYLLDRFDGDLVKALAAYNAGPGAVDRYGGVPPYAETEDYVKKVLSLVLKNPPTFKVEYARDQARLREEVKVARQKVAPPVKQGDSVYLMRDQNNQILITTAPPAAPRRAAPAKPTAPAPKSP
jgi:Transglycosylase SLT domain